MDKRIVYPTAGGGLAVITPTGLLPIEEVARKDVPAGVPFLIVDAAALPDRARRADWSADFAAPDGHGADYGVGSDIVVRYGDGGVIVEAARLLNPGEVEPRYAPAPIPEQAEVAARQDRAEPIRLRS